MNVGHPNGEGGKVPDLVRLASYAILGGGAGKPVSVSFRDFPQDLLVGGVWNYLARSVGSDQVATVWTFSDIRKVEREIHSLRLVLVYPGRASNVIEWHVEQKRGGTQGLPAVFSIHQDDSRETAGSTLVANATPAIVRELLEWAQGQIPRQIDPLLSGVGPNGIRPLVTCDRLMRAIRKAAGAGNAFSFRDHSILEGLLAGATIYRSIGRDEIDVVLEAEPADYAAIRPLLEQPFLQDIHVPADDLTKVMLDRANLFLEMQRHEALAPTRPLGARRGYTSRADQQGHADRPRSLSRNELVDLGNPRSSILKDLITKVIAKNDLELLKRLGLSRPDAVISRLGLDHNTKQILEQLPTWTYKQVRTRFDRLRKEGLIEVQQPESNSPCIYVLPLEVAMQRSCFAALPEENAVRACYH